MSKRKLLMRIFSCVMTAVMFVSVIPANAVVLTFETQYDYETVNAAWLTDLVIKEDMTTVEGMAQRVDVVPRPEYPYTETAESFSDDVDYFMSLYNLDMSSQRAGYIYFFEMLNANSGLVNSEISDADIREYLEGLSIVYPSDAGSDDLIMARVLFTALATGSLSSSAVVPGIALESLVVNYLSAYTGMDSATLAQWSPSGADLSLDEYILAASKLSLWSNGYNVTAETPENEVYRLLAAMTVKNQGISVDSTLSFDELKISYTAALLGTKYNVTVDSKKLAQAKENDSVAYYMLQLIGRKYGLSVREDNATYEEAFELVAENTGVFDVSADDFYADIYDYDIYLKSRCKTLWIYPTAYSTNENGCNIIVTANGTAIKNNYYNEIEIDYTADVQQLVIEVTVSKNGKSEKCRYNITVHQGSYADVEGEGPVTDSNKPSFGTSDSVVADTLSNLGMNSVISAVLDKSYISLPATVTTVVSFMAPTFDAEALNAENFLSGSEQDNFYISVLDEVGALVDADIKGVPGIELSPDVSQNPGKLVTFD